MAAALQVRERSPTGFGILSVKDRCLMCLAISGRHLDPCLTRRKNTRSKSHNKISSMALPVDKQRAPPSEWNLPDIEKSVIGTKFYIGNEFKSLEWDNLNDDCEFSN